MAAYQKDQVHRNNLISFLSKPKLTNESVNDEEKNFLYKFNEIYNSKIELEKLSSNEAETAKDLLLNDVYRTNKIKVDSTFTNSFLEQYEFVGTFGGKLK